MKSDQVFQYVGYSIDSKAASLTCTYDACGEEFVETVTFPGGDLDQPGVETAAFIYFLLAGISYYKTKAPLLIDLGDFVTTTAEQAFLLDFYREGLGEFAYENNLDLSGLHIQGPTGSVTPIQTSLSDGDVVIPFGGGIDSIVTVSELGPLTEKAALFVAERPGARFEVIEEPAGHTGLPILRAERVIDQKVLDSKSHGYVNGHVPVTGILSALAVMGAVASGFGAVAMSNERSASAATRQGPFGIVNHQWSKGLSFEQGFRELLNGRLTPFSYFSWLRSRSELSVASVFSTLTPFHDSFRSCNRAFHQDPARRLETWCGICDKCLFVDLVLAPSMSPEQLRKVFRGNEPLENEALRSQLEILCGVSDVPRPFECVGDEAECQEALIATALRPDRRDNAIVQEVREQLSPPTLNLPDENNNYIPERYASRNRLV